MIRDIKIAPSILAADFGRLDEELRAIEQGGADMVHVDVMDGHFVPNLTIGPMFVEVAKRATALPLDVHLMIANPDQYVERYVEAGATWVSVHAEVCGHLHRTLQQIRAAKAKAGVVLNPATHESVIDYALDMVDMVLVMSVNPGFGGQSFIDSVLPKISALAETIARRGLDIDIEVDGGVKIENVDRVASAGANVIVSGTGIFAAKDYGAAIADMRARAQAAFRLKG